jgi:hypothetical protein
LGDVASESPTSASSFTAAPATSRSITSRAHGAISACFASAAAPPKRCAITWPSYSASRSMKPSGRQPRSMKRQSSDPVDVP